MQCKIFVDIAREMIAFTQNNGQSSSWNVRKQAHIWEQHFYFSNSQPEGISILSKSSLRGSALFNCAMQSLADTSYLLC